MSYDEAERRAEVVEFALIIIHDEAVFDEPIHKEEPRTKLSDTWVFGPSLAWLLRLCIGVYGYNPTILLWLEPQKESS